MYQQVIMWSRVKQFIGMVELEMENKYLQVLISTKLRLEIIQKLEKW